MNNDPALLLAGHPQARLLADVGRHAAAAGFPVAAVGGFVRDLLLGIISQDIDIVVEGDAIACARLLAGHIGGVVTKTSRFGTAVLMAGDTRIDLAMARTERYPHPGALPEVSPGTLADDLWRRDFTVNAIALGIGQDCFGSLIDDVGGREDLRAGIIRTLHPGSFSDDPTRMLRAIRLAHRLRFSLAAATADCLREAVRGRYWLTVGHHRLGREIRLLFRENDWPGLCRHLEDWGLFSPLFASVLTVAKLAALESIDAAADCLGRCGLAFERTTVAALIIGGRAGYWLQCESECDLSGGVSAIRKLLAAPGADAGLSGSLTDIPPAVLAYLWIICQNEEERLRLQTSLAGMRLPRERGGKS